MKSYLRIVLPFAALAFLAPAAALAQGKGKGESSGPVVIPAGTHAEVFVIQQPGAYVLGGNRVMSDGSKDAIFILAPDVTLDLGGFSLSYADEVSTGCAIMIHNVENVEIRNGTIAKGNAGIVAQSGKGLRVVDVRLVSQGDTALATAAISSIIDRVTVSDAGEYGLGVYGGGSIVTDSVVSGCKRNVILINRSRVVRTIIQGGLEGLLLGDFSSASECTITDALQLGVYLPATATLRNVDVMNNVLGVFAIADSVIAGSRITHNVTSLQGSFTSGGGNVIK